VSEGAELLVSERPGGWLRFGVHVQPRSSRTEVAGVRAGALRVRLQAPPVDGAANDALVGYLAERLGLPRRAVRIVAGLSSRAKTVEVDGIDASRVRGLAECTPRPH
jgi:uncharacterized protein (TIGR00251 family)